MLKSLPLLTALAFAAPGYAQTAQPTAPATPAQTAPATGPEAGTPPAAPVDVAPATAADSADTATATTGAGLPAPTDAEQAKALLASLGYSNVTAVSRGAGGTWTARATKDGKPGNVVINADGSVSPR